MAVNLGMIGLGWFANLIARSVSERGDGRAVVAAACDVDSEKLREFKSRFNVKKAYDNPDDLVGDPDVDIVIIATPPYLHASLGKKALLAGKHVFLEKPGALRPEELGELIEIAREKNLKTTIDYVMRRNPLYLMMKMICDSKAFGLLERADLENYAHDDNMPPQHWFWDYSKSGGIWVEHGVHFFDLINWLIGPPREVRAVNIKRSGENLTDRVLGFALHEDDAVVTYYHGFTKPEPFEKTTFYFTFERAYAEVYGWIPVRLVIDALATPETEEFMGRVMEEARKFLPSIDIELTMEKISEYGEGRDVFSGRGKRFKASFRTRFEYTIKQDRWEVYRACVMRAIDDLADAVEGVKTSPAVTLIDARRSLEIACRMEEQALRY
ncbi:Gfo/Idh/MocA family protein [Thermosediminibacter litoriperuensis]|uniref:Putative dehydrogenase n=1 Tax=Thermosediminibacter litoriperuensis TaxID=291989 RepID=A0A5S5AHM9_9FIRM|nr:Gfo/Idh/MocA family oxidoreductase [Thermosediminibacter litoriperuensis]TYP48719.1 putative dehydrogenase [Thermosediminibacter litoriperuensis]